MKTTAIRMSFLLPSYLADEIKRASKIKEITQSEVMRGLVEDWRNVNLRDGLEELSKLEFNDVPTIEEWISIRPSIN
jgi:hypothetical protein